MVVTNLVYNIILYYSVGSYNFMEQNRAKKDSKWGRMARAGKKVRNESWVSKSYSANIRSLGS